MTEISELVEFGKLTKQNACKVPGVATFYFLQYLSRLPVPAPSCLWPAAFLSKAAISFLCALKIIFLRVTVLPSFLVDSEVTIHVGFFVFPCWLYQDQFHQCSFCLGDIGAVPWVVETRMILGQCL